MYYFSKTLWDFISEKFRYEKVGVVVYVSEIPFIIDLSDTSNEIDWRKANKLYGAYLPTIQQANDIVKCFTALDNAIKSYGGQTIDRRTYWTNEPEYGGDWHKEIDSWASYHKPAGISQSPNTKSYGQSVRKVYRIE